MFRRSAAAAILVLSFAPPSAEAQFAQGVRLIVSRAPDGVDAGGGIVSLYEDMAFAGDPTFGRRTLTREGQAPTWSVSVPVATTNLAPLRSGGAVAISAGASSTALVVYGASGSPAGPGTSVPFRVRDLLESASQTNWYALSDAGRLYALASNGDLTPGFGGSGSVDVCDDASALVSVSSTDVLIVCGASGQVEKYNLTGARVTSFGQNGVASIGGIPLAPVRVLSSGKLQAVVAASTGGRQIVRLSASGALEATCPVPESVTGVPAIFSSGAVWFYGDGVPLTVVGMSESGLVYGRWDGAGMQSNGIRNPVPPVRGPIVVDATNTAYLHYSFTTTSLSGSRENVAFETKTLAQYPPSLQQPVGTSPTIQEYPATLTWTPILGASRYVVEIAHVDESRPLATPTVVRTETTTLTSFLATGVMETYSTVFGTHWRVRAVNAAGDQGLWSAWTVVRIAPPKPGLVLPAQDAPVTRPLILEVASSYPAIYSQHQYEIATDGGFTNVADRGVSPNGVARWSVTTSLPSGTYYARVRTQALSELRSELSGRLSGFSAPHRFTVQDAFLPPTLVTPADGAVGIAPAVRVSWTPSAGASRYQVEIVRATDNQVAFSSSVAEPTTEVTAPLAPLTLYRVRVRAMAAPVPDTTAWTAPRLFATGQGTDAAAPDEPATMVLHVENPVRAALVARYVSPEPFAYTLVNLLGAVVLRGEVDAGAGEMTLPRADLASGLYVLRVRPRTGPALTQRVVLL